MNGANGFTDYPEAIDYTVPEIPATDLPSQLAPEMSANEATGFDVLLPITSKTNGNGEQLSGTFSPVISEMNGNIRTLPDDFPVTDGKTEVEVNSRGFEPFGVAYDAPHTLGVRANVTFHPTGSIDVNARISPMGDHKLSFSSFFNKFIGKLNIRTSKQPDVIDSKLGSRIFPSTHPGFPFYGPFEYVHNLNHENPNEVQYPHGVDTFESLNYYDEPAQLLYEDSYF